MTPTSQVWGLQPGADPASIQAEIRSLLASAQSGCSTAKVTQKVGGFAGYASVRFHSQTWWCWDGTAITNDPILTVWGARSTSISFEGVTLEKITRGGKGHDFADDRAEGKFCGTYCLTVWITKTVRASGDLGSWDSGTK